ncbi:hypothetical protein [Dactylosporangium aurantiacum]|uniref:hypothetical protein n=1 Tax=Dactylosporangium aurantiacum TaxID=35754 RepID=UPI0007C49A15|nr:hypothetical protein [Dactylosporangium aurantiacum]MDG6106230.1 hypothetical protein [Dactylosporangium aurantiacum]
MSGERAVDVEEAGPDPRAIGIEVFLGAEEGPADSGAVRVVLPQDGKVFCTWGTTVSEASLIRRIGALTPAKQHWLDVAFALSVTAPAATGTDRGRVAGRPSRAAARRASLTALGEASDQDRHHPLMQLASLLPARA